MGLGIVGLGTFRDNLLSADNLVEAPYIKIRFQDYEFGGFSRRNMNNSGSKYEAKFPDYIKSMTIQKINGQVNKYTINLIYPVRPGQDPNFMEKVLSSIEHDRIIYISYGDYCKPSLSYREEKAIVTNTKTNIDFKNYSLTYTIHAVSDCLGLMSSLWDFPYRYGKPSSIIKSMVMDSKYKIKDIFTGFSEKNIETWFSKYVLSTDKPVLIEPKNSSNILDYFNYLTSCMVKKGDPDTGLKSCKYALYIEDGLNNKDLNGTYFGVKEIPSTILETSFINCYEVDIGYSDRNSQQLVSNFSLNDDRSWSILYDQSIVLVDANYERSSGQSNESTLLYSSQKNYVPATNRDWWSNMTSFPIKATLTIKGLIRPLMLMNYLKINVYFYGRKHVSSGYYVITAQNDSITDGGYQTTLSLLRLHGDENIENQDKNMTIREYNTFITE